MLTSARNTDDPWQYLRATLSGIEQQRAAVDNRILVCDGNYTGPFWGGWQVVQSFNKEPGSANRDPWFHALKVAFEMGDEALCLEDDISMAPGALQYMLDFGIPGDLGFVQFFASKVMLPVTSKLGLHRQPRGSSRFLQANKYTRAALLKLQTFRKRPEYALHPESADQTIGLACKTMGINHALHFPSLVQHIGAVSKNTPKAQLAWWRQADDLTARMAIKDLDPSAYG